MVFVQPIQLNSQSESHVTADTKAVREEEIDIEACDIAREDSG